MRHAGVIVCRVKQVTVKKPADIRQAILVKLSTEDRSKYRFAVDCVKAGICQHHTVDELLSPESERVPSLPIALAMIEQAGLEVIIRQKQER